MSKSLLKGTNFRSGVLILPDLAVVLGGLEEQEEKEVPHTLLLTWDATDWGAAPSLQFIANSICLVQIPKRQIVAIGPDSDFIVYGKGDDIRGKILDNLSEADKVGPFTAVRDIEGQAYAVGMDRIVYKREGISSWVTMDKGLPPGKKGEIVGFQAIHGFSDKDIYAVGWNGEIWHYNGKRWDSENSPINSILTGVCCAGDGNIYICGRNGILIKGKKNHWKVIEHAEAETDFWDVEWFKGKLYLSSIMNVFELDGDILTPCKFGKDHPDSCYHLSAVPDMMWSIGKRDIMAFDGSKWKRVIA